MSAPRCDDCDRLATHEILVPWIRVVLPTGAPGVVQQGEAWTPFCRAHAKQLACSELGWPVRALMLLERAS